MRGARAIQLASILFTAIFTTIFGTKQLVDNEIVNLFRAAAFLVTLYIMIRTWREPDTEDIRWVSFSVYICTFSFIGWLNAMPPQSSGT